MKAVVALPGVRQFAVAVDEALVHIGLLKLVPEPMELFKGHIHDSLQSRLPLLGIIGEAYAVGFHV